MRGYGWAGLLLLATAEYGLYRRIEPFYSWFYCFAWWSYILLADNLLAARAGRSLLTTRRAELSAMLPLSVVIWLLFEAYNLVIRNWAYDGVPWQAWVRWPGYAIAFATVLPGIFITSDLIGIALYGRAGPLPSEAEPVERRSFRPSRAFVAVGAAFTAAPLIWPDYFFPAVWVGPLFLLDPALEKLGLRSLGLDISGGHRRRVWSLLAGGLLCGLLWEFWNFWAPSRWIYTVPFFGSWKVFEMPLLGFLGFPPFALECWVLYHLLRRVFETAGSTGVRAALWVALLALSMAVFYGIDRYTVARFASGGPRWRV